MVKIRNASSSGFEPVRTTLAAVLARSGRAMAALEVVMACIDGVALTQQAVERQLPSAHVKAATAGRFRTHHGQAFVTAVDTSSRKMG